MAALLPVPVSVRRTAGEFALTPTTTVWADPLLMGTCEALRQLLSPATGFPFRETSFDAAAIRIRHDGALGYEAYLLNVNSQGVDITAVTQAGAYYALQTLRQLLPADSFGRATLSRAWLLPAVEIRDMPRFPWRGMHLDVSRHFLPVNFIKQFLDALAAHKFNRFHWHLTDDQGWRIEIKRYPKLTEAGALRAQTVLGNSLFQRARSRRYDGVPHGGFYTQAQIREVVDFAAARHITVVPEIEFPGHAQAAITAYPELGNTGAAPGVKQEWGISRHTLKPSDETLDFFRNVLTEVLALFPSPYIHIGGDEASSAEWLASPFAQQRMQELGLAGTDGLQSWMISQLADFLAARGRTLVGWDEIMQGGLPPGAVVMSWRGMEPGLRAAEAGHDVVMAPTRRTYFDYYQADARREPLAIGGHLPLADVYAFDPAPTALQSAVRAHILGAQGQLWTEFIPTPEHVEYMAFPRAAALAEVLWSPAGPRDFEEFRRRLAIHLERLTAFGLRFRPLGNDTLGLTAGWRQRLWHVLLAGYFRWSRRPAE